MHLVCLPVRWLKPNNTYYCRQAQKRHSMTPIGRSIYPCACASVCGDVLCVPYKPTSARFDQMDKIAKEKINVKSNRNRLYVCISVVYRRFIANRCHSLLLHTCNSQLTYCFKIISAGVFVSDVVTDNNNKNLIVDCIVGESPKWKGI